MKLPHRQEIRGKIVAIKDDHFEPDSFAWIDVAVGDMIRRFLVTQSFRDEHDLYPGQEFAWKFWSLGILNLLNPVIDYTKIYQKLGK